MENQMQEQLEIVLKSPNSEPRTVTVKSFDSVNVLLSSNGSNFPQQHSILLNNCEVLSPSFSFKFYKIKNGDELQIIPNKTCLSPKIEETRKRRNSSYCPSLSFVHEHTHQLFQLFGQRPDQESLQQAVEELADPKTASESARLRDQYYNKIEGSVSSHRRLLKRFHTITNSCTRMPNNLICLNLTKQTADEPSTSALPCIWKRGRKKGYDDPYLDL